MSLKQFNLIYILFFITIISVSAQYGVRLAYNNNTYSNWENAVNLRSNTNKKLLSTGYQIGVDYWFKLKKRRIEFMPEIFYSQSKTNYDGTGTLEVIKANAIGFNFHTQIYALDLEGDCDCPTFSKEGASINKGLFFSFYTRLDATYYNGYFCAHFFICCKPNKTYRFPCWCWCRH
ncbi:MAG: hypothetical protein IPO92_17180 [Saprospiraceae bacterium]|nr:hypothetical protein [Saprospiraceae bacterium]